MGISGIAAVASLASVGFGAAGSVVSGAGTAACDTYKAETLDRAAQYGDLKATQTGAQLTRNLSVSLGNIAAIRAAARTDPTSPTGAAVRGYTEQIGTEQKNIQDDSITAQAQEDEANAAYLRSASSTALLSGDIGAFAGGLKALSGGSGGGTSLTGPGSGSYSGIGGWSPAAPGL